MVKGVQFLDQIEEKELLLRKIVKKREDGQMCGDQNRTRKVIVYLNWVFVLVNDDQQLIILWLE
jgi:hypothetical protein